MCLLNHAKHRSFREETLAKLKQEHEEKMAILNREYNNLVKAVAEITVRVDVFTKSCQNATVEFLQRNTRNMTRPQALGLSSRTLSNLIDSLPSILGPEEFQIVSELVTLFVLRRFHTAKPFRNTQ